MTIKQRRPATMSSVISTSSAFVPKSLDNIVEANITLTRALTLTGFISGFQWAGGRRKGRAYILNCPAGPVPTFAIQGSGVVILSLRGQTPWALGNSQQPKKFGDQTLKHLNAKRGSAY